MAWALFPFSRVAIHKPVTVEPGWKAQAILEKNNSNKKKGLAAQAVEATPTVQISIPE